MLACVWTQVMGFGWMFVLFMICAAQYSRLASPAYIHVFQFLYYFRCQDFPVPRRPCAPCIVVEMSALVSDWCTRSSHSNSALDNIWPTSLCSIASMRRSLHTHAPGIWAAHLNLGPRTHVRR